jgi:hypothetical protein
MRTWLTTREVRALLGGISQPRVSQLVKEGLLICEPDGEGRLRYDRPTAEALARNRASRAAATIEGAEERKALQDEARDRFKRERERARAAEEERTKRLDDLKERTVRALESIAKQLRSEDR